MTGRRFFDASLVSGQIAAATTAAQIDAALGPFATAYGVDVVFPSVDDVVGTVQFTAIASGFVDRLRVMATQLVEEFACYPPQFVMDTVCNQIYFVGDITSHPTALALASGDEQTFWVVAGGAIDPLLPEYRDIFRGVFHHEFMHMIDGTWPSSGGYLTQQAAWVALNPPGFTYGGSYSTRPTGFMTTYGATAYLEDRADVHRWLISSDTYAAAKAIGAADPAVKAKAALLREFLTSKSSAWFGDIYAAANVSQSPVVAAVGGSSGGVWQAFTRDADARRTGPIDLLEGSDFTIRHNSVGVWSAECPTSPGLWSRLERGGGLVIRRDGHTVCSGPITNYGFDESFDESSGDRTVTIHVEGVTDEVVLADRIVYPDPARLGTAQTTQTHWRMTGPAENVMCALVDQQTGPSARPERRAIGLSVAPSQGRGVTVSAAIRFGAPNMLAELQTIARTAGLGFRVAATPDGGREFQVFVPSNRAKAVRFGSELRNVAGQTFRVGAPTVTYSLTGGKGEGAGRLHRDYATTDDDWTGWRRRIETYVDARDTDVLTELDDRSRETVEDGAPEQSFTFTTLDTPNVRLFERVNLGDRVTVYAGAPEIGRVAVFEDLVREIHGEISGDSDVLRAAVGSEGASTGVPLPSMKLLLRLRADLQALKGSA